MNSTSLIKLARISYRQLDYWTRKGWLPVADATPGSGKQRIYKRRALLKALYLKAKMALRYPALSPNREWEHGTKKGYEQYGCRCRPCRKAVAQYQLARRHRDVTVAHPYPHGSVHRFRDGCCCAKCVAGNLNNERVKARYQRRREAGLHDD